MQDIIPLERIESKIYIIRSQKVMLDNDLARLYKVSTSRLNEQVKRNKKRFSEDFMFQLNREELKNWMSQIAISNPSAKMGLRKAPYAFTEQGVAMLSSVLRSVRAIEVNIQIMRAFVRIRQYLATHKEMARKIEELDKNVKLIFRTLHQMMNPPEPPPEQKKEPAG